MTVFFSKITIPLCKWFFYTRLSKSFLYVSHFVHRDIVMLEQKKTLPKVLLFFKMPLHGVTLGFVLLEMTGIAKPVNYNKKAVYSSI